MTGKFIIRRIVVDRLKQIESFVAVTQKGSLTAAAAAEAVAPAVIGRRIDALEEYIASKGWS